MAVTQGRWGEISYFENDQYVGQSLLHYGEYNPDETETIIELAGAPQEDGLILDIGANFGCIGQALETVGHKVAYFEPQPDIFRLLCKNVKGDCHCLALGAGNRVEVMPKVPPNMMCNYGGLSIGQSGPQGTIDVQVKALDSFEFQNVYLIKMDVEGYERLVLQGAIETIERCKPIMVIEDDRPDRSAPLQALIRRMGYTIERHDPLLFREKNFFNNPKNIWYPSNYASGNIICRPL